MITIPAIGDAWLAERTGHLTDSTRDRYRAALDALALRIPDLSAHVFTRWEATRRKDVSAMTFNIELNLLKTLINFAVEKGWLESNPIGWMRPSPVLRPAMEVPTRDELADLLAEMRRLGFPAPADTVEILALTGLRIGELRALQWLDVEFHRNQIIVGRDGQTKGKATRTVPLLTRCATILRARYDAGESRPLPHNNIDYALDMATANLGLPHYHPHVFRHYFATEALNRDVPVDVLARWLGHKDGGSLILKTYNTVHQSELARWTMQLNAGLEAA